MMHQDDFQSLEQILQYALQDNQIKYFAYALSRARCYRDPNYRQVTLLLELIYSKDTKWIQVLERLAIQNYQLVFQFCKEQYLIYPSLVNLAHPLQNKQSIVFLQNRVFQLLQSSDHLDCQVLWCAFVELIIRSFRQNNLEYMLKILNRINSTLAINSHFFDSIQQLSNGTNKKSMLTIYSTTGYKIFACICRLYKHCCKIFRKQMNYLLAQKEFTPILSWIRNQYQNVLVNGAGVMLQNGSCETTLKEDVIACLLEIQNFVELQDIAITRIQSIVQILLSYNLISSNNLDPQQRLNWQYGLICHQYGDDLPSNIAKTTITLARSLPTFLIAYITHVSRVQLSLGQIMMRYIIVNKQLIQRKDLVLKILQPFLEQAANSLQSYSNTQDSQLQFCRKIRLLMFYSQILKQKYFSRMIECIIQMLGRQSYKSYCFLQGYNLMRQVIDNSNSSSHKDGKEMSRTAQLIKGQATSIIQKILQIIAQIYQQYPLHQNNEERQNKLYKLLELFQEFISRNRYAAQRMIPQVLKKFCNWTIEDMYAGWRVGRRSSGVSNLLIRTIKQCLMLVEQDYTDVQQAIYDLLDLLKNPNIRDYYQDFMEILVYVINQDIEVSPRICFVIVELQRIVDHNRGLYSVVNVIKALCITSISASILYNWPDLCLFLFNLFTNSLNNMEKQYQHHYSSEFQQVLATMGTLIQTYTPYLQQNKQVTNNILYCLDRLGQSQMKLQLLLLMSHLGLARNYSFIRFQDISTFKLRNTFKLIFIVYCDKLRNAYSEDLLNQLIQISKIYKQKQDRKVFQPEINLPWACFETSTSIYISQTLQVLKRNKSINSIQLTMLRRELSQ